MPWPDLPSKPIPWLSSIMQITFCCILSKKEKSNRSAVNWFKESLKITGVLSDWCELINCTVSLAQSLKVKEEFFLILIAGWQKGDWKIEVSYSIVSIAAFPAVKPLWNKMVSDFWVRSLK